MCKAKSRPPSLCSSVSRHLNILSMNFIMLSCNWTKRIRKRSFTKTDRTTLLEELGRVQEGEWKMEVAKNHYLEAKAFQFNHLLKDKFLSLQQLTNFLASVVSHCPGTTTGKSFPGCHKFTKQFFYAESTPAPGAY